MEWRKYREVAADDEESFDERPNDHSFLSYCKHTLLSPYPWMLCTFALLCVICFLVWHGAAIGRNSYAGGFDTEFGTTQASPLTYSRTDVYRPGEERDRGDQSPVHRLVTIHGGRRTVC